MASFNKVILMGNLTKDPELRYIPSGAAVCDMSIATNRKYTAGGEKKEETCFIDIVVWGKQGEASAQYLTKGRPVLVEGRLVLQTWEKDGAKRSKHVIVAERVQFLGNGSGNAKPAPEAEETPGAEDEVPF